MRGQQMKWFLMKILAFGIFFSLNVTAKEWIFWTFCLREFRNSSVIEVWKFFRNIRFFNSKKFWSKNPVLRAKTGVSKHSRFMEYSEFVLFKTFLTLQKIDVKIELWKLRKTCSNSNSNSNIWVQVRNAGP